MAIVVNTNIASLQAQRNLGSATIGMNKAMERLATGYKINNAGDDAAGLMISKSIEAQQRGSEVAIKNSQDGFNLLATAEGNLDTMQNNLLRIRDLCLQGMNGGQGPEQIAALAKEATLRMEEINRTSNGAKYGDFLLFDPARTTPEPILLQIGAGADKATNTVDVGAVFTKATFSSLTGAATATVDFSSFTGATARDDFEELLNQLDTGIKAISARRGEIGATQNRLDSTVEQLTIQNENLSAANSRIKDADVARESSNFIKYQILQQASASLLTQANQTPSIALSLI